MPRTPLSSCTALPLPMSVPRFCARPTRVTLRNAASAVVSLMPPSRMSSLFWTSCRRQQWCTQLPSGQQNASPRANPTVLCRRCLLRCMEPRSHRRWTTTAVRHNARVPMATIAAPFRSRPKSRSRTQPRRSTGCIPRAPIRTAVADTCPCSSIRPKMVSTAGTRSERPSLFPAQRPGGRSTRQPVPPLQWRRPRSCRNNSSAQRSSSISENRSPASAKLPRSLRW
mmetsp:Transcript_13717/g.42694  ORF Transcript_13717/g.42694 Transcript_13717/m.42694 type:complete len:226 (-) Transcript_13717:1238-1915(-)